MNKRTAAVIPAFNAESTLGELLQQVGSHLNTSDIVVVDDGSTDRTREIAQQHGAVVLWHSGNRGKGEALKTGFSYTLDKGYEAILTLDADLQHDPASIPDFLALTDRFDLVVGNRLDEKRNMSRARVFSNTVTTKIVSWRAGTEIADSQCGYRLISSRVLKNVSLHKSNFELESELLINAGRLGFRIGAVTIPTIYRGESSHIRHFADTLRFVRMIIESFFWKYDAKQ